MEATLAKLCSDESNARTLEMLRTAMGPVITDALDDPAVIEIMVNSARRHSTVLLYS